MKPTPLTDQIALDTRVEFGSIEKLLASHRSLERDRAELIEALRETLRDRLTQANLHQLPPGIRSRLESARALLRELGEAE